MQNLLESWWEGQRLECVHVVGKQLAQAVAAEVLQGCVAGAGADHFHATFGRRRAHHRVESLVLKFGGCNSWVEITTRKPKINTQTDLKRG